MVTTYAMADCHCQRGRGRTDLSLLEVRLRTSTHTADEEVNEQTDEKTGWVGL